LETTHLTELPVTTVLGETRTRESAVLIGTITKQTNLDTTTTTTFFPLLRCRGTTSAELAALSAGASFAASGQTLPPAEEPPQTGVNWFSGQESSIRINANPPKCDETRTKRRGRHGGANWWAVSASAPRLTRRNGRMSPRLPAGGGEIRGEMKLGA
jgi:hypothetical protein